jgi:hypothetical protein
MKIENFQLRGNNSVCAGRFQFFFSGEGPRSRRYGRTAAMRLLVQPYDEVVIFCPFPSN